MVSASVALTAALLLPTQSGAIEWTGGKWFDGREFRARTMYARGGVFLDGRPEAVETSVDLGGGYVVPPFAEAHNHNVHDGAEATVAAYLAAGVFYIKSPNDLPRATTTILASLGRPDALDVVFARGGLTGPGGHPLDLVRRNVARGLWTEADGEGAFLHTLAGPEDLERKWPVLLAAKPDFVKTYLLYSEEYAERLANEATVGWRGLDPALLPAIVARAHAAGLRVSTHVETATDFHHAVAAGVDEVNHLPGFRPEGEDVARLVTDTYRIRAEDARAAGERGLYVVTTLGGLLEVLERFAPEAPERELADGILGLLAENLALLLDKRVRLALGSDEYEGDVVREALAIHRAGLLRPEELLTALCRHGAETTLPARRVGRLEPGFEASFLVLEGDPLADFTRIRALRRRVKQGLSLP